MKIGLFTDSFYPEVGGVATSCYNLERALTRLGHEVQVYAPRCKGWKEQERPNVHYLTSRPLLILKDRNVAIPHIKPLHEAINAKFDVVHTNSEFVMGYMGRYVAHHSHCALVHTYHTVWEDYTYYVTHGVADETARRIVARYSEWWCDHFGRIIVPTAKTQALLARYGVTAPMDVIPSGMDLERFDPARHSAAEIAATRAECGVKPGERVLLNIGRMAKEKNLVRIMDLFPALLQECPDVRLVLVGEGPQRQVLSQRAAELGVAEHVSIVGAKPWEEIDKYYAIGDVFVSASHTETQGLTYIEAMASGLCVCAARDPCLFGVIEDGVNGILSGDSDMELLACLQMAFSPMGKRIAQQAISAAQPFGLEAFGKRVEACYLRAMERHGN